MNGFLATPTRFRLAAEIVVVLAVIVLPLVLLTIAGDSLPPTVGQVLSLLILPAAALVSWLLLRADGAGCAGLGLRRARPWGKTLVLGIIVAVALLGISRVAILPVVMALFGSYLDPAMFDPLQGDIGALVTNVLVAVGHAALCEEIIFRGFLLQRLERVLGASTIGLVIALGLQAALFGLAHYPQGNGGMMATALGGVVWGAVFVVGRRNLWIPIIGHAVFDTIVFLLVFFGQHRLLIPG